MLVVEDDSGVRNFMAAALRQFGYDVTSVAGAADALAAATQSRFDLVVSDVVMPGMDGPALCRKIRELRPGTRALYVSGYPGGGGTLGNLLPEGAPLLQKPFSVEALLQRVRGLIEQTPG